MADKTGILAACVGGLALGYVGKELVGKLKAPVGHERLVERITIISGGVVQRAVLVSRASEERPIEGDAPTTQWMMVNDLGQVSGCLQIWGTGVESYSVEFGRVSWNSIELRLDGILQASMVGLTAGGVQEGYIGLQLS